MVHVAQDLRPTLGKARNQGERPTCAAFAVSDAHASMRANGIVLSAEHLYYHAVQRSPGQDPEAGVSLGTALKALGTDGQCAETGWPYLDALPGDPAEWKPPASATPCFKRSGSAPAAAIAELIKHLDGGLPVIVAMLLGRRFYSPVDGIVVSGPSDENTAYHAVLAIGHGHRKSAPFILIRNSWGEGWGAGGHAWIEANYLAKRLDGIAILSETETT